MAKVCSKLLFLSAICIFIAQAFAQPSFLYHFCLDNGNYTSNSTYKANLNQLLSSVSSNTEIDYGFYNSSYGQNPDKVYAIGLCRGDVKPDVCRSCLNNATNLLPLLCPNQKEAIGWYDYCMLRYTFRDIFGIMEASPVFYMWNNNNVSANVDQFNQDLRTLLDSQRVQAAKGGSLRKFAAGNATAPNFQTLYSLVQCIPDLSEQNCSDCLVGAMGDIPQCCDGKQGGRVVRPSCNLRYEVSLFYDPTAITVPSPPLVPPASPSPPSTNSPAAKGKKSNKSLTVIIIVVPTVAFLVLIISICIYLLRVRKPREQPESDEAVDEITNFGLARLFALDQSEDNTNRIVGTYGYMAPEYAMHGQFSAKSDTFSFGVLVLEIISGKKNSCFRHGENIEDLLSYAWKNWREGKALNLVDSTLKAGSTTEIMRCIHIGLLCVQENVADRPSMASVVLMLNSYSLTMPIPLQPAFFMHSNIESDTSSQWDSDNLPTRANLARQKVPIDPKCAACGSSNETVLHILWQCPLPRNVWALVKGKLQKCDSSARTFFSLARTLKDKLSRKELESWAMVAWSIWNARNRLYFEASQTPPHAILKSVETFLEDYQRLTRCMPNN
nr:cysteine-rich receptor-like protein kinase 29 [Quercus suber]